MIFFTLTNQWVKLTPPQTSRLRQLAHEFFELSAWAAGDLFREVGEIQFERKVQRFADEIANPSFLIRCQRRSGNQTYFNRVALALDKLKLPNRSNFVITKTPDGGPQRASVRQSHHIAMAAHYPF